MRKFLSLFCCCCIFFSVYCQRDAFNYKFYGFAHGAVYYNSRSNVEVVNGLFYLYPKNTLYDSDGKDLNATSNGGFYTLATRLGLDIKGPEIGKTKTSAKIETDFGGTANIRFMLRLRQAYIKLSWQERSSLILGQTWHPLFGEVAPNILNLSAGAPFQPFNRSPQVNYQYRFGKIKLTTSALYQLMYTSHGPEGKSEQYLKNGVIPEIYAGIDYHNGSFLAGAGVNMLSLKPRLSSVVNGNIYKVNERITSFSYDLHLKYTSDKWRLAGKTLLASNLTHTVMPGGYGVTEVDNHTGEQKYTPFRHSSSWINVVYGTKYQAGFFAGYMKNLGTSKTLISTDKLYGSGFDIDQLLTFNACIKYVLPHCSLGLEYTRSTAWYGDTDLSNGKVTNTHDVSNNRIESSFIYFF